MKGFATAPSLNSNYLKNGFVQNIDKNKIKTIFEVGSLDVIDALLLNKFYSARVFTFECNPSSIKACRRRLKNVDKERVTLIERAVWSENRKIPFYPVVAYYEKAEPKQKWKNPGASSCFRDNGTFHERYIQREIFVDAVRLDSFCQENKIDKIDLICMDPQGAALEVLIGLGGMLQNVHYIICEISISSPIYKGEHCYDEVYQYLKEFDFEMIYENPHFDDDMELEPFADYLFVNKSFS